MKLKLFPTEYAFFDDFEQLATIIVEASRELLSLLAELPKSDQRAQRIKELEHDGDDVTHRVIERLHKTFLTPLDREDIHTLVTCLDDILDAIEAAGQQLDMYEIQSAPVEAREMAKVLVSASEAVRNAVKSLRDLRDRQTILSTCVEIAGLENRGDAVLRLGTARLFREEKDAVILLKWKDIYQNIEEALDRCQDVSNVIEGIVIESA